MSRFGNLIQGKAAPSPAAPAQPTPVAVPSKPAEVISPKPELIAEKVVTEEPVRARDENGHFIPNDPSTPENEAWVGGIAPNTTKKPRRSRRSKKSEE